MQTVLQQGQIIVRTFWYSSKSPSFNNSLSKMNFDVGKFPKYCSPLLISYPFILKPSGISAYTPRIPSGNPCASVNINQLVNASGFSFGLGTSGASNVIWTRVRCGNRLKN